MRDQNPGRNRAFRPLAGAGLATLAASLLPACSSPVGNGVGPVSLALSAANGTTVTVQGVTRIYQCFAGGVTALLYFSDGTSGNFTNRVKWSSSNPGVVRVSNGDIPAPDGSGVYAAGTLVPIAPGNAQISATYSTLTQTMPVSVGVASNFTIKRVDQSVPTPVSAASLGVGTAEQFRVSAVTDDVEKDVTAFARWTIGGSSATVSSAGVVSALGAGGPSPLTASFLNCDNTASADITVANITGIEIAPEFGSDPLLLGNSEKINVLADLDNGVKQDVSLQSVLTSTDGTIANFLNNILVPVAAGTVTVQAALNNTYMAPDQTVTVTSSTLTGLTVSPTSAVLRAGSDQYVRFQATGTFQNGQTQDVSRAVTWAVLDTTLATINNDKATAGFATPNASLIGQTTVTATPLLTDSTAGVASATLTVDSAANPSSP